MSVNADSPPDPGAQPLPTSRKFKARRINEHVKAVYGILNTLAATVISAAYIIPTVLSQRTPNELDRPGWVLIGLTLHAVGQFAIWRFWKSED